MAEAALEAAGACRVGAWVEVVLPPDGLPSLHQPDGRSPPRDVLRGGPPPIGVGDICEVTSYRPQGGSLLTGRDHRFTISRDGRSTTCSAACLRPASAEAEAAAVEAAAARLVGGWVELTRTLLSAEGDDAAFQSGTACLLTSYEPPLPSTVSSPSGSTHRQVGGTFVLNSRGERAMCRAIDVHPASASAVEAALVTAGVAEEGAWVEVVLPPDGWSSHRTWGRETAAQICVGDLCRVTRFAANGSSGEAAAENDRGVGSGTGMQLPLCPFTISRDGVSASCSARCLKPVDLSSAEATFTAKGGAQLGSWVELIAPPDGPPLASAAGQSRARGSLTAGCVCQVVGYDPLAPLSTMRFTVGAAGVRALCSALCLRLLPLDSAQLVPQPLDLAPLICAIVEGYSRDAADALPSTMAYSLRVHRGDSASVRGWRLCRELGLCAA